VLQTTPDLDCQPVKDIRCKLCPYAQFSNWADFQRHYDAGEDHPCSIFYDRCGDYFGRKDSHGCHVETVPKACRDTTEDEAASKCQVADRLFKDFDTNLDRCLGAGEDVGPRFVEMVNTKLPSPSKKKFKRRVRSEN
jgi:hypothetical protein